jgi:CO/xanthine dehydrogenase Mo-binding subunit
LVRAAKAIGWKRESSVPGSGKGLGCCMKDGGGTYKVSAAVVKMTVDSSIVLSTGTVEVGQGAHTALSQVVAEELSVPLERIEVAELDTDATPYDSATNASSSMVVMGLCVQRAAQDLKKQLLRAAAKVLRTVPSRLALKDGKIHGRDGQRLSYEQVLVKHFGAKAGELVGKGSYQDRKSARAVLGSPTTFWEVSWGAAEVNVDRETGFVELSRYVSLADVGKAIHPQQCLGQDEGAVMMAVGHTLYEEMIYRDGQLANPGLINYHVPNLISIPS